MSEIKTAHDGLSLQEAADELGVVKMTVWHWWRDGQLPNSRQIGRRIRIHPEDVEAMRKGPPRKEEA